ncbi:MAG: hypothetical protein AABX33_01050 [Nanoarchaeota archaeon]
MAETQIISESPINIYDLKKELERIKKRDNELNYRAAKVEDYINQVGVFKNSGELFDKIIKLNIPRLKEQHVHKIIDLTPASLNELKVVLQGYTITLSNESMRKIVDAINEFLGNE